MEHSNELNVLVIEDDPNIRDVLTRVIHKAGHQVVSAGSAEEGLSYLPSWSFQLAFLDHRLPGMEGLVLGEYLRRNNPDMTIALITGEHDSKLVKRTGDSAITYLRKPFDLNDVLEIIDETIAGEAARVNQLRQRQALDFDAPIGRYAAELAGPYGITSVPARIEERVVRVVKDALYQMRLAAAYNERDRVVALAGLLSARVLGIDLPKSAEGTTLYQEYDQLMRRYGRRTAFAER